MAEWGWGTKTLPWALGRQLQHKYCPSQQRLHDIGGFLQHKHIGNFSMHLRLESCLTYREGGKARGKNTMMGTILLIVMAMKHVWEDYITITLPM